MKPAARNGIEVVRLALAMMLIVVAGAGDDIWAAAAPDSSPSPAPATTTKSASSAPATQPRGLALFQLHSGAWKQVDRLPVNFRREHVVAISLAVLDDHLTLAMVGLDRGVRVYTRTPTGWSEPSELATFHEDAQMKLLSVRGRPALWLARANSSGELYFRAD